MSVAQDQALTPLAAGRSVRRSMRKRAPVIEDAQGFGLDELIAGRRSDGSSGQLLWPSEIEKLGGPSASRLSRVLAGDEVAGYLSAQSVRDLATVLKVEDREALRAYSVTVLAHERARAKG